MFTFSKFIPADKIELAVWTCDNCKKEIIFPHMALIEGLVPVVCAGCQKSNKEGNTFTFKGVGLIAEYSETEQDAPTDDEAKINWLDVLEAARDAVQESYKTACGMGEMRMASDLNCCYTYLGVVIDLWGLQIQKATAETQREEPML